MKRLMVCVERAVRPVRAEENTKCNMREELYAHIVSIFQEELERTGDENTATTNALRRFGDLSELTTELQASVSPVERHFARLDGLVHRRKGETVLRHAGRMVVTVLLSYSVLAAVTLTTVELLSAMEWLSRHAATNRPLQFQILVEMGLWFLVQAGVFTVIGHAMRSQLEAGLLRPRSFLVSGGLCLIAGMTVFVSTCCLFFAITGNLDTELLPRWLLLASLLPFGFAAVSRLAAIEVVRSRQWTSLDIAD